MIRTRIIERINTPQDIVIPGGIYGTATVRLDFQELPSAGTVTFERRASYQGAWLPIQSGTNLSVTGAPVEVKFDGGVHLLRVTFTGLTGGMLPVLTIVETETATPPSFLLTDGGFGNAARLRVDNGQTGFFDRRMWDLTYEFSSTNPINSTPVVFRFVMPTNFIIHHHSLEVDSGGVVLRTYAESQGTPGGVFGTAVNLSSSNSMTEEPAYAFQSTVTTGGTFTPTPGVQPITLLRVRTAGATAQQNSVGGEAPSEKGRAPGIYYAVISRMSGVTGDSTGSYRMQAEERPQ
ncbi:hypothetical protein [Pseudomonas sp.]|uniref:hypothetical protein n=1 Tax=Pseudomonas sp. TaxID=306 RepID=UPI002584E148|nr:hypothetical protein [Pseudomonas sp.]